jgi:hypothetical protein
MKFILYAQAHSFGPEELAGTLDHSALSLLNDFSGILRQLGDVTQIYQPEDADCIYAQCLEKEEACLLFSFMPPHLTPMTLSCPVVLVFAWEYANIPEQIEEQCWMDDPRHDWRFVLSKTRGAIVLSTHARDAIRRSMGPTYPVTAVNWPLRQCLRDSRVLFHAAPNSSRGKILSIHASVADSQQIVLDVDAIICEDDRYTPPLDPADIADLPAVDHTARSIHNASVENSQMISLFEPGLIPPPPCSWDLPPITNVRTRLRGTVYTAVLTPSLDQDNWEDLLTGFCWSFRTIEDATLVLVIDDPTPAACQHRLIATLTKLSPLKCRILAIYGIPSLDEYEALIRATTYYVNTSFASRSCRWIADFLAAGVPAIAPMHTGLRDLISEDSAFVIRSMPGTPTVWPHGDHDIYRTSWHQIDWQSLVNAFNESRALATEEPAIYLAMTHLAKERALAHCSTDTIKSDIQQFLSLILHQEQQEPSQSATTTLGRNHDTARLYQHCR